MKYTIPVNVWLPIELRLFSQGFFIFFVRANADSDIISLHLEQF